MRLSGQRGLGGLDRLGDHQASVGRDAVAGFQQHDIAGHQGAGVGDHLHFSVAAHARGGDQHLAQSFQAALGAAFLQVANGGVDDEGVLDVADDPGDDRSGEQNADQPVAELIQQTQPLRSAGGLSQLVGPPPLGPLLGVHRGQARGPGHAEQGGHLGGIPLVGVCHQWGDICTGGVSGPVRGGVR